MLRFSLLKGLERDIIESVLDSIIFCILGNFFYRIAGGIRETSSSYISLIKSYIHQLLYQKLVNADSRTPVKSRKTEKWPGHGRKMVDENMGKRKETSGRGRKSGQKDENLTNVE